MFRPITVLAGLLMVLPFAIWAQSAPRPLERAMELMRAGDWAGAQIEARADGQAALDVILWHYLRAGLGAPREVQDFLARNPDWPGLPFLREKSEEAMTAASTSALLRFYADHVPETGAGALSYAHALSVAGDRAGAEAIILRAWRTLVMSEDEQAAFLARHAELIAPHHTARLDAMLWRGVDSNARAMLPLVNDDWRALAEARLALRADRDGVDGLIAAVPAPLSADAGLAYERFAWRLRKGRTEDAGALILARSTSSDALGRPHIWARQRDDLVRRLMWGGQYQKAYDLAAGHHLEAGSAFADLEWLAGYVSLRFLDAPERAAQHFRNLRGGVESPISLGRAGYWLGRALEATGDAEGAAKAYAFGAQYQTSFYGLLAAEAAGLPPDPRLTGVEPFPDWRSAAFTQSSVFEAAILLLDADEKSLSERFFTHLSETLPREQIGQMGRLLADLGLPHMQVMLGKRAAQYGHEIHASYYALHSLADAPHPVPTEIVLAIARRESEFDPAVISPVGARGLMQVMPRTAQEVSQWVGETYSEDRLLTDPAYNTRLGTAYLARLAQIFDGNAVMMSAAYNAGPSRPERWMQERGDPRRGGMDVIDWIEHIPFGETRNYVMRVTESLPIYRARLGRDPHPVPFSQELTGSTLLPLAPQSE